MIVPVLKVKCEVCEEVIATARPERLSLPLTTRMFDPKGAGFGDTWVHDLTWLHMTCPYCGARPFVMTEREIQDALEGKTLGPGRILTADGPYTVGSNRLPGVDQHYEVPVFTDEELEAEWTARTGGGTVVESLPASDLKTAGTKPKRGRPKRGSR